VRSGKESFEMMIDLVIKHFNGLQLQIHDPGTSSERQRGPNISQAGASQPPPSYTSVYTVGKDQTERGIAYSDQGHPQTDQFDSVNQEPSFGISKLLKPHTGQISCSASFLRKPLLI
jgi:hypothetical protein